MNVRTWIAFVALCLVWGLPYLLIKLALAEITPAWIAFGRTAIGAAILVPFAWRSGGLRQALARKGTIVAFATLELIVPFLLIALGERWISSSLAGILIAAVPLVVIVLAPLFGIAERLGTRRIVGFVLGFVGVVALLGIDSVRGPEQWLGVGCLLVATVCYGLGSLVVQRHLADVDELGTVAASLLVAAVLLLPLALTAAPDHWPSTQAVAVVIVLGVVCTSLGLFLYVYLIGAAGAARATVVTYINPAVAAVLGVYVLDEHFGLGAAIGLGLILVGSWLGTGRATGSVLISDPSSPIET